MKISQHTHRFLVYLCLTALVLAAVSHFGADLPVVLLAVFWIFVAVTIGPPLRDAEKLCALHPSPFLPVGSPRPPPTQ